MASNSTGPPRILQIHARKPYLTFPEDSVRTAKRHERACFVAHGMVSSSFAVCFINAHACHGLTVCFLLWRVNSVGGEVDRQAVDFFLDGKIL